MDIYDLSIEPLLKAVTSKNLRYVLKQSLTRISAVPCSLMTGKRSSHIVMHVYWKVEKVDLLNMQAFSFLKWGTLGVIDWKLIAYVKV